MAVRKQLEDWVNGKSTHNNSTGECCPDFSCCKGRMADKETRERFKKAVEEDDEETVMTMLMMFLGRLVEGKEILISGDSPMPVEVKH